MYYLLYFVLKLSLYIALFIIFIHFRFECLCLPGTTGIRCEIDINECDSNPCRWGSCENRIGGYACLCDEGFEGVYCDIEIDECDRFKYDKY